MNEKTIFTIGTQSMNLVNFVRLIKEQDITRVVDIREEGNLVSNYGKFAPRLLKQILVNINVDYVHLPEVTAILKVSGSGQDQCSDNNIHETMSSHKELEARIRGLFNLNKVMILSKEADYDRSMRKRFALYVKELSSVDVSIRNLSSKDLKPMQIPPPMPPPVRG